ncbi:hypothetical protein V6N12_049219 [Hibiscus sabdariffa]|uniref:Uncharacterized protein n=1 Tax=Hibiscus sabdariffa TaxID=183260 RepID=A0ABR2ENB3_9ROSI
MADTILGGNHGQSSIISGGQSNFVPHFQKQDLVIIAAAASGHNPGSDIQMGLANEEIPIEYTYGNKRARMNSGSTTMSSVQGFNVETRVSSEVPSNTILADLMNQVRREQ